MNHRERLKVLVRKPLFHFGVVLFVIGIVLSSIFDQKDYDAQIVAAIFAQGGIIVCLWAYWQTRLIVTESASQARLMRRSRMGVALGIGMVCLCFMLTPAVLMLEIPKMLGFLFWYSAASGFIGLFGLVSLFVWLKRRPD